jgi:rubrerythrin
MDTQIRLEDVDVDGAVREAHADAVERLERGGDTRASFMRKVGLAGGSLLAGGSVLGALLPSTALAAGGRPPSSFGSGDIGILNYALTLEYLESSFYNEAYANLYSSAPAAVKQFLTTTRTDEADHVAALKGTLGSKAAKKPTFAFGKAVTDLATFEATAFVLENTGVAAYSGQAFNISSPKVLAVALSIVTVEARHAGAIASILGKPISPDGPFDEPDTAAQVLAAVAGTKFITS